MKFINEMVVEDMGQQLTPFAENMTFKMHKRIDIRGDLQISIQASFAHYCNPRKTLQDLYAYTSMEFALLNNGEFVSVTSVFPGFSRLQEIEEYYEGSVYGYVPVELIEELFQSLK